VFTIPKSWCLFACVFFHEKEIIFQILVIRNGLLLKLRVTEMIRLSYTLLGFHATLQNR
jgi:hypothetical protein